MTGRVSAARAQARTRSTALRRRMDKVSRSAFVRRAGRIGLLPAVTLALLAGLGVAFAAYSVLRSITPVDASKAAAEIDVTRVALTVVAGVGGVVALVIAYRRQRDLEQSRFVERFGAAAAQLGATDVAVRIAGVYAMAGVADESDSLRRQQCIDVLCGYLRLPYNPELGGNHQTKHVRKRKTTGDAGEDEDQFEYRQNDREVRATIIRVIADHILPEAEISWSAGNLDFRTAYLEDVDFARAVFPVTTDFRGATFSGHADFGSAVFTGTAEFRNANFSHTAWFNAVTFSGSSRFDGTTFIGTVDFGDADFRGAADFRRVTFCDNSRFRSATFSDTAQFGGATLSSAADFGHVTFSHTAWFRGAVFAGVARFDSATFADTARFAGTTFSGGADFHLAIFSGTARFDGAIFSDTTDFGCVTFADIASFVNVDFGTAATTFNDPEQWGPPPPVFDWDHDIGQKPTNVAPQEWPPAVSSAS